MQGTSIAKDVFPDSGHRPRKILDLIHSNICGPMSSTLLTGNLYYNTFIDDSSKKTYIYFVKTKDETLSRFQEFKAIGKNQIGKKIHLLRSDNGGEYTFNSFNSFCKKAKVKRESALPYNTWKNGVAKGKNKSILEIVKSMVHGLDLPMLLWLKNVVLQSTY